jgi:hypothetical protein
METELTDGLDISLRKKNDYKDPTMDFGDRH